MAARFDSLHNDDINASGRRPLGFPYGPYLMDDLHAGSVGTLNMGRGIGCSIPSKWQRWFS